MPPISRTTDVTICTAPVNAEPMVACTSRIACEKASMVEGEIACTNWPSVPTTP
jgi:hypothetical protein